MSGIDDIIVNTINKDFAQANNDFNDIMLDKMNDRLDAQRASIAQQMAGQVSPPDELDNDAYEITNDDIEDQSEEPEEESEE